MKYRCLHANCTCATQLIMKFDLFIKGLYIQYLWYYGFIWLQSGSKSSFCNKQMPVKLRICENDVYRMWALCYAMDLQCEH